jgi:uncharacterized protein (TIGR03437 family)
MSPNGRWIAVITTQGINVIDTQAANELVPAMIGLNGVPTSFAILPDSSRILVSTELSAQVQLISLLSSPPQGLAGPIMMPVVPRFLAASPNFGGVIAVTEGAFYKIDPATNSVTNMESISSFTPTWFTFNPEAPVNTAILARGSSVHTFDLRLFEFVRTFGIPRTIAKIASPGVDSVIMMTTTPGQFHRGTLSAGTSSQLLDPATGQPFALNAVDVEVQAGERNFYLAFSGDPGSVVRLNAAGTAKLERTSALTPTGLAVISTPGVFPVGVSVYGGNNQLGTAGIPFLEPLAVRVVGGDFKPIFGATVTFTSNENGTLFNPKDAVTNLNGVARTIATPPVVTPFEVTAEVTPSKIQTKFQMNVGGVGQEGLSKASGDFQHVLRETEFPFPLTVRALNNGLPVEGLEITFHESSTAANCPTSAMTNADGEATVTCAAGFVTPFPLEVEIQAEDTAGRMLANPFVATILPTSAHLPTSPFIESPGPISGVIGQEFPESIRLFVQNNITGPVPRLGITFTSMEDTVITPSTAVTAFNGVAVAGVRLGCQTGNGKVIATLNSTGKPSAEFATVTARGPASTMIKTQGDGQQGGPGQFLNGPGQALNGRASDECGNLAANQDLIWSVSPPDGATLVTPYNRTNSGGQFSTLGRLGIRGGPVAITAQVGLSSVTFNLTVNVTPTQLAIVQGNGQRVIVGQRAAQPLIVELRDEQGGVATGRNVTFEVTQGSAVIQTPTVPTNEMGRASVNVNAGNSTTPIVIVARSQNLTATFNLTPVGRTPMVSAVGFVNAASFQVGWVPGSAGSIFGTGLMETINGIVLPSEAPFPTRFRGVRVLVNGSPAPILGLATVNGTEQVNLQVPVNIAPGTATVSIENNDSVASFPGVVINRAQPGIFVVPLESGVSVAAVLHADFTRVTPSNPARPGETVAVFLTGLGPTNPPILTNTPGPGAEPFARTVDQPTVTVDGANAQVLISLYAPFLYTAYQINFVVPPGTAAGNRQLRISSGGVASNLANLPVGP